MNIVHILVETRPQYGTSERLFIGCFEHDWLMDEAIDKAKKKFNNYQNLIEITPMNLNEYQLDD
jgi:hypothetical protein